MMNNNATANIDAAMFANMTPAEIAAMFEKLTAAKKAAESAAAESAAVAAAAKKAAAESAAATTAAVKRAAAAEAEATQYFDNPEIKADIENFNRAIRPGYTFTPDVFGLDTVVDSLETRVACFFADECKDMIEAEKRELVKAAYENDGLLSINTVLRHIYRVYSRLDNAAAVHAMEKAIRADYATALESAQRAGEKAVKPRAVNAGSRTRAGSAMVELNIDAPELSGLDIRRVSRTYMLYSGKKPVVRIKAYSGDEFITATRLNIKNVDRVTSLSALGVLLKQYLNDCNGDFSRFA